MSDFAPPSGPPPGHVPQVPEGWKAVYNDKYDSYFYVNLHTKKSQWDKPTAPAPRPDQEQDAPPGGAPPSYSAGSNAPTPSDSKHEYKSNNPYQQQKGETDEEMARRLQAEENQRPSSAGSRDRGANSAYYTGGAQAYKASSPNPGQPQSQTQYPVSPDADQPSGERGLLGKLKSKLGGGSSMPMGGAGSGYGGQQQYGPGYGQQQQYGGYPQQQYGYGPPPMQQGYGYPQQQYGYAQQPPKRHGLGTGGAAALGVGGGLLGGMLLADAFDNNSYQQGFDQGAMDNGGGYDGGDMGGGDMGGGDMGGF